MTKTIDHAEIADIEKGRVYRSVRVPRWMYRVESIVDAGAGRWVMYTVIGGSEDGRRGKILVYEFARRVRA